MPAASISQRDYEQFPEEERREQYKKSPRPSSDRSQVSIQPIFATHTNAEHTGKPRSKHKSTGLNTFSACNLLTSADQ